MSSTPNFSVLLGQINRIRLAFDNSPITEMPQGRPGDALRCPIAMSLANGWSPTVDGNTVKMSWDKRANRPTLERFIEIAKKLKASGFTGAKIYNRWDIELWPDSEYEREAGLSDDDDPRELIPVTIQFDCTRSMTNFIEKFDDEKFEHLIKGRSRNSVL